MVHTFRPSIAMPSLPTTTRLVTSTLLLTLVAMLTACGGTTSSTTKSSAQRPAAPASHVKDNAQQLMIGTAASAPPFVYREDGAIVGLEVDLAAELARRLGRPAKLESIYFANLPSELRNGRLDILMAGITITPARKMKMAFTEPYLATGQQAVIHKRHSARFASADSLNQAGVRVGVESETTGAAYADHALNLARIRRYPTVAEAIEALAKNQVDAVVHDAPTIAWQVRNDRLDILQPLPNLLTNESIAWAVRLDDAQLLADANKALADMKADGTLDRLIAKWIK